MNRNPAAPAGRMSRARSAGFTLLELLVVLAILVLIASFAAPQALKWLGGAKTDTARVQIEALSTGIDLYKLEVGTYPERIEDLVEKPAGVDRWNGPYLKKTVVPKDPWDREYVYTFPGEHGAYDLMTLGADNADGGEGEDRDITSWQ